MAKHVSEIALKTRITILRQKYTTYLCNRERKIRAGVLLVENDENTTKDESNSNEKPSTDDESADL